MRRPARVRSAITGVATALAVVVAGGCGSSDKAAEQQTLTAPPQLPAPPAVQGAPSSPTTTPVYVPLPIPIAIPLDSYADEPVVEYGWMSIPKIGLDHKVFQGATLHNIDRGPSHWPGTARPGQRGNAVFAGHRVTHSHPFLRINELAPGDEVVFTVDGLRSTYKVTDSMVVDPEDTWIADQTQTPTATLYACHPPGSAAQRYVVQMALQATAPV